MKASNTLNGELIMTQTPLGLQEEIEIPYAT